MFEVEPAGRRPGGGAAGDGRGAALGPATEAG